MVDSDSGGLWENDENRGRLMSEEQALIFFQSHQQELVRMIIKAAGIERRPDW